MGIYIELGSNLLQTFILTWFISNFFGYKYTGFLRRFGFAVAWLIVFLEISYLNSIIAYEGLLAGIFVATYVIYARIFLTGSLQLHIFLSIFAQSIIFTTSGIMLFIGASLSGCTIVSFISTPSILRTVLIYFLRIIEYLIFRLVIRANSEYTLTPKEWILFVAMPLLSWGMLTLLTNATIASEEVLPFMLYAAIIMLGINLIIYFFMFKIKKDSNARLELELVTMQQNNTNYMVTNIKALLEALYSFKHDLEKYFLAIKQMAADNDCPGIISYIADILKDNAKSVHKMVVTDNDVFNAIINTKLELCKQKDIVTSISVDNQAVACMDNKYAAILLGNIFDNAIEAAEKSRLRVINFSVRLKRDYISIYLENSYDKRFSDISLKTTKKNTLVHGYGVKTVRKIVTENNGMLQYFTDGNDMFCCDILLPKTE